MHPLNIAALFPEEGWKFPKVIAYKSPVCVNTDKVFYGNMMVVQTLGMVPGYAFMNGEDWGISVVRAMNELGSLNPDDPAVQDRASKIWDDYDRAGFDESADGISKKRPPTPKRWLRFPEERTVTPRFMRC